ncbi:MAG: transcription elongation factor GreA [Candidatus Levybacteria bacterium]|nr:transcription elongation factor GreA [Candidatus Levybacteria bacterium]
MNIKKIYLTQKGFEDLKLEYKDLNDKRRPEVVERLSAAREMGDLSENAEYTAAREELSFIDGRLDELEGLLKGVEIISDAKAHGAHAVDLGSQVTIKTNGKEILFTVVGEWEADPAEKKISHESPLGKALLGKAVGDEIEVDAPAGKMVYTVVSIN